MATATLAAGEDVVRALRALARKSARARGQPDGSVTLAVAANLKRSPIRVEPQVWSHLIANGFVQDEGDNWKLSKQGLRHLRRCLSAAEPPRPLQPAENRSGLDRPVINDKESPLAWLRRRRDGEGRPLLSSEQFEAGERLRSDYHFAQLMPRVTQSWSASGAGGQGRRTVAAGDLTDAVVGARQRVDHAITAVGPDFANVLIEVCCHLRGIEAFERMARWPQRSGKVVLMLALNALARHYGLARARAPLARQEPVHVRHWGAEGYQPQVDTD